LRTPCWLLSRVTQNDVNYLATYPVTRFNTIMLSARRPGWASEAKPAHEDAARPRPRPAAFSLYFRPRFTVC
jgi:hypothetical protein